MLAIVQSQMMLEEQMQRPNLPDFRSPPVTEVALSFQFAELDRFQTVHLGLLWEAFGREEFPRTEEHSPVPQSLERFGVPNIPAPPQIELLNVPPMPRCFFLAANGTEVIQVQNDRFTFNWRKRNENDAYPRFEAVLRKFETHTRRFADFLETYELGDLKVLQAEATYVNRIENIDTSGQLQRIVSVYSGDFSDDFLDDPEEVYMSLRFPMRRDGHITGRLYVDLQPSIPGIASSPRNMTLLARGKPADSDINGLRDFFQMARQYIVSAFASVTSAEMHKVWERTDNA